MRLEIEGRERVFEPAVLVVIGYAGRDRAAVEVHIDELAELGVPRPASIPLYMAFPPWLISQAPSISVAGADTSGEAELVVVVDGGDMFVTLGSDHTDRVLEAVDIVASKGICPKPVANTAWAASSIGDRWDDLTLRSSIDGGVVYQDGPVAANLPPSGVGGGHSVVTGATPVLRRVHGHGPGDRRHPSECQLPRRAGQPGPRPHRVRLPG